MSEKDAPDGKRELPMHSQLIPPCGRNIRPIYFLDGNEIPNFN